MSQYIMEAFEEAGSGCSSDMYGPMHLIVIELRVGDYDQWLFKVDLFWMGGMMRRASFPSGMACRSCTIQATCHTVS